MGMGKIRVLVVDDEKIIRDFFSRLLSLMDIEVVTAEDGHKAVELAKAGHFDLYFIDVRMPVMNGLETFRAIRAVDPDASVTMMTGYAVEDILSQAKAEGAGGPIRKPFDIAQIKEVLDKVSRGNSENSRGVLVVDDDQSILDFFATLLKNRGLSFAICRNSEEALDAAKRAKFSLVFLDLFLNNENGVDVYNRIRQFIPDAEFILMTGHPEKAKEIKDAIPFAGCLYKPFEIEYILKYIEGLRPKKL